jgi:hypothetical protein
MKKNPLQRLDTLEERVERAERDKNKAERDKDKAERRLDDAEARLKALEDVNAAADVVASARADVAALRADVTAARMVWSNMVDAHKSAIDAESRAVDSTHRPTADGAHLAPFTLEPSVRTMLARPLSEWRAGETFDVSGIRAAVGNRQWHDQVYLRATGLDVLKEWEANAPFLAVHGTPGIGKSTLLQLAVLRALVLGEWVLLFVAGVYKLIKMVNDAHLSVESVTLGHVGVGERPGDRDVVVCYDSPAGFQATVGHADGFKKVFIVHSPSGDLNNTTKSDGVVTRFFPVPPEAELLAVGAIKGIDAVLVRERIARYGPTFRYVANAIEAEKAVDAGISAMVDAGVEGLTNLRNAARDVHRITLMVRKPAPVGEMLVFASDYIRDEVVRRMANTHAVDLLRLANTVDIHGSLRGQVFENRMLDTLSRARAKIEIATGGGGTKVFQIAGAGVTLQVTNNATTLPVGDTLQFGTLYRPPFSNNPSWDALFVENNTTAYLLQMTVSDKHPVKLHGLAAGKQLLAKLGFTGKVHVVFLLPPVVFARFKLPQKILNADGNASATADQWSQDTWCVTTFNDEPFWPR